MNAQVLKRMGKKTSLTQIKERKSQYLGHTMRGKKYLKVHHIKTHIARKNKRLKKFRKKTLKNLRECFGSSSKQQF